MTSGVSLPVMAEIIETNVRREEIQAVPGQVLCPGPHEEKRCRVCRAEV